MQTGDCEQCGDIPIFELKNGLCEFCLVKDYNINTMKIEMTGGVGGSWIDKASLQNGDLIKIKSEALWVEGREGMPKQLVAKMRVKGQAEDVNVSINTPSRNAMVQAFGDDTSLWVDKVLTVAIEKGVFAGKRGTMLNLVPENYVVAEDAAGYILIRPKVEPPKVVSQRSKAEVEEDINIDETPF